jgi:hypothetical protein
LEGKQKICIIAFPGLSSKHGQMQHDSSEGQASENGHKFDVLLTVYHYLSQ